MASLEQATELLLGEVLIYVMAWDAVSYERLVVSQKKIAGFIVCKSKEHFTFLSAEGYSPQRHLSNHRVRPEHSSLLHTFPALLILVC